MDTSNRWWDRLNRTFFPFFGPAQIGPGPAGEREITEPERSCPICGELMTAHEIVRSTDGHTSTRLVCP